MSKTSKETPNTEGTMAYWVVGAMFGGVKENDQYNEFVREGYWYCWDANASPKKVQKRFRQIQPGDYIAIKRLLGQGQSTMEVRAIGIVTNVNIDEWRVYVKWLRRDLSREVPFHGCAGSIHGPFQANDDWTRKVFQLYECKEEVNDDKADLGKAGSVRDA